MILNMSDEEEESMSGEEELFSQSKKDIHTQVMHMQRNICTHKETKRTYVEQSKKVEEIKQ